MTSGAGIAAPISSVGVISTWNNVPMAPPDSILGITEAFNKDTDPRKVSLGVGAYRGDDGKPLVLETVRKAERMLMEKALNHEYAGIVGLPEFTKLSLAFAYGKDSQALKENRIAGIQSLSGTGACRVAGELFARFRGEGSPIYIPNPTWGNHVNVFDKAGLEVRSYRYYDPNTLGLDFEGLMSDVEAADDGSLFLLHACAHNPTGVDPTQEQWAELSMAMKAKRHVAFFDCAYQGFASGDPERDAWAIRRFVADGHCIALAQSFAKNFGLYGERIGALSVVCTDAEEAARVTSQIKRIARPMYSNPPLYGARLVAQILSDDALAQEWALECKAMADRIIAMRSLLKSHLMDLGSGRSWEHITNQIGMFCYTGLTKDEVLEIRRDWHIYMTDDGRISMAGINSDNVQYVAESIHSVTGSTLRASL
uniref:Aspartate aminotransferase n=1 Tax=Sargassum muticum TaxID=74468 RepID=A0A097IUU5_9PHAE|nr:aspartate aminotransferase [Sargassum muticum]AIT70224.1 aspartate aminotransferase [Sargassum muticum]